MVPSYKNRTESWVIGQLKIARKFEFTSLHHPVHTILDEGGVGSRSGVSAPLK